MVSTVAIFDLFWLITEFFLISGPSPQRSAPVNKDRILFDKIAATPPTNGYSGKLRRPVRQKPPDNNPKSRQKPHTGNEYPYENPDTAPIAAGIPQWTRSGSHPRRQAPDKGQTDTISRTGPLAASIPAPTQASSPGNEHPACILLQRQGRPAKAALPATGPQPAVRTPQRHPPGGRTSLIRRYRDRRRPPLSRAGAAPLRRP